jgi:SAM-dependent methyltransferase
VSKRISQDVAQHYERWPFPGDDFASPDGLLLLRTLSGLLRRRNRAARVLDAGCGTGNTAIALARLLPHVSFTGIDRSRRALAVARRTAHTKGTANVVFQAADLSRPACAPGTLDVVLSLGVVHHMPDRSAALARLREWLAPGGRLLLWVYGRHGRHAHNLNQRFLKAVTRGCDPARRYAAAQAFVRDLGERFALGSGFYTPCGCGPEGMGYLLARPQWLADQMIPAYEEPFDLPELLELLHEAGLRCERWLGAPDRLEELFGVSPLLRGFARLSTRERLLALDCLLKPDHYFLLVRRHVRRASGRNGGRDRTRSGGRNSARNSRRRP